MKNLNLILFACFALFLSSCVQEKNDVLSEVYAEDVEIPVVDLHEHNEVPDHLEAPGLNLDNPERITVAHPDGTTEERFLIEKDITVSEEQLRQMRAEETNEGGLRQYRTYNLVNAPRTIRVVGYTGSGYALSSKMQTALSWAIDNYNGLNTGLSFSLSYGATTNADIVVYQVFNGSAGGQAGFPSGGNPYKWVQIFSGLEGGTTNLNEHVIGHEIGHCLGLRHTDYASRASCGGSGEGAGSIGAVHIPGTSTGIDWNSLMLACFSGNEDGEFGPLDRVALEYLY